MLDLPDSAACRENMHRIRAALADYHNDRGPAVYGLNSAGACIELRRARLNNGTPYAEDADGNEFVLRGARTA